MAFKNWELELTESNLKEEIANAKAAGKKADAREPRALSVYYNQSDNLIVKKGGRPKKNWQQI